MDIAKLAQEFFPAPPAAARADRAEDEDDAELDATLHHLLVRRRHGERHAWVHADAAAAKESAEAMMAADSSAFAGEAELRIPREYDRTSLLQSLAIKDALLRQMEAALLLQPPPDPSATVGLLSASRGAPRRLSRTCAVARP